MRGTRNIFCSWTLQFYEIRRDILVKIEMSWQLIDKEHKTCCIVNGSEGTFTRICYNSKRVDIVLDIIRYQVGLDQQWFLLTICQLVTIENGMTAKDKNQHVEWVLLCIIQLSSWIRPTMIPNLRLIRRVIYPEAYVAIFNIRNYMYAAEIWDSWRE